MHFLIDLCAGFAGTLKNQDLENRLAAWRAEGLITHEQFLAIDKRETQRVTGLKLPAMDWLGEGLTLVGVILVAGGLLMATQTLEIDKLAATTVLMLSILLLLITGAVAGRLASEAGQRAGSALSALAIVVAFPAGAMWLSLVAPQVHIPVGMAMVSTAIVLLAIPLWLRQRRTLQLLALAAPLISLVMSLCETEGFVQLIGLDSSDRIAIIGAPLAIAWLALTQKGYFSPQIWAFRIGNLCLLACAALMQGMPFGLYDLYEPTNSILDGVWLCLVTALALNATSVKLKQPGLRSFTGLFTGIYTLALTSQVMDRGLSATGLAAFVLGGVLYVGANRGWLKGRRIFAATGQGLLLMAPYMMLRGDTTGEIVGLTIVCAVAVGLIAFSLRRNERLLLINPALSLLLSLPMLFDHALDDAWVGARLALMCGFVLVGLALAVFWHLERRGPFKTAGAHPATPPTLPKPDHASDQAHHRFQHHPPDTHAIAGPLNASDPPT